MADRIGNLWFQSLVGAIPGPRQVLKPTTWPGENGVAFKKMGKRSRQSQLSGLSITTSLQNALAAQKNMEDMAGTIQLIQRQGILYESRLIVDVDVVREFQITGQVNSSSRYTNGSVIGSPLTSVEIRSVWVIVFGSV